MNRRAGYRHGKGAEPRATWSWHGFAAVECVSISPVDGAVLLTGSNVWDMVRSRCRCDWERPQNLLDDKKLNGFGMHSLTFSKQVEDGGWAFPLRTLQACRVMTLEVFCSPFQIWASGFSTETTIFSLLGPYYCSLCVVSASRTPRTMKCDKGSLAASLLGRHEEPAHTSAHHSC